MDLNQWCNLSPVAFIKKLRKRLSHTMAHNDFINLYNVLMMHCETDPSHSAILADATSPFLRSKGHNRQALLFDELSARAHIMSGDISKACRSLGVMLDADRSDDTRHIALELAEGALRNVRTFGYSDDQIPLVLARVGAVLRRLGRLELLAQSYLNAANIYARHGAYQAAYRCASDAEDIAHEIESTVLLARAAEVSVTIACYEGDFEWAISAGERALDMFNTIHDAPTPELLANLGLARMRAGQNAEALRDFRASIELLDGSSPLRGTIALNLATCLRISGDVNGAVDELKIAREFLSEDSPVETRLELEFVSARIASQQGHLLQAASNIDAAAQFFDDALRQILRLHHRRGLRERFIPRFESLLRDVSPRGCAEDILRPIAIVRGNALGDWLALLKWVDSVEVDKNVSATHRGTLTDIIVRLRAFGVPHLYGFFEKYDDPWEPGNDGVVWDELSRLAGELMRSGIQRPLEGAELTTTVEHLRQRLSEGHAFMTVTHAGDGPMFWTIFSNHYIRIKFPHEPLMSWKKAQLSFGHGELDRRAFMQQLQAVLNACVPLMQPVLNEIAALGIRSIRYLQTFDDPIPLAPLILANEALASQVSRGACELRSVPALYLSDEHEHASLKAIASMNHPDGDLLLPRHEAAALADWTGLKVEREINANERGRLTELIGAADTLLVSTHGYSLDRYTDPYFASMDEGHAISVANLQECGADLQVQLVMLNACHSAVGSARNYQMSFRTSDAVTYPSLFLLNRKAVVSGSLWRISDTASFLYTCLVGEALEQGVSPAIALSRSVVGLKSLTKSAAIALLGKIVDPTVRQTAIQRLGLAPEDGAFSHPYLYGAITVFGLL